MEQFKSSGKLLISGEYLVLEGATALAIPTRMKQSLMVQTLQEPKGIIHWQAYDSENSLWFQCTIDYINARVLETSNPELSKTLLNIFTSEIVLNQLLQFSNSFKIQTQLEFHKDWGLGTSSTLINNIAQWLKIDAFQLQKEIFHGSGYDIACAQHTQPLLYKLIDAKPKIELTEIHKEIQPYLYFVYSNQKQNSREGISRFRTRNFTKDQLEQVSNISIELTQTNNIGLFQDLIQQHNLLLENILHQAAVPSIFEDFEGIIKPLGAWGGDFFMAIATVNPIQYFQKLGYKTLFTYPEIFNT